MTFDAQYCEKPRPMWPEWCRFPTINGRQARLISVEGDTIKFEVELIGNPRTVTVVYESITNACH